MNFIAQFFISCFILFLFAQNISAQSVPEATSGFQWPLSGQLGTNFYNNGGASFLESYDSPDDACGTVYHPAQDWNIAGTSCDGDIGYSVYAAANGKVVDATYSWGGIVIQHLWQGQTFYTVYGHFQKSSSISLNTIVTKGQLIGTVDDIGTGCAHLHFEVRESDHPQPANSDYWTCSVVGSQSSVNNYYEDPATFIPSHGSYSVACSTPTSSQVYALNTTTNSTTAYSAYNQTGTTQWQFGYKLTTSSTWINTATTTNGSLNIPGLQAGMTYNLNCRALCNGSWTAWSLPITFTTLSSGGGGSTPINDNPCGAITLTANSSCSNTSGSNVGATNTTNPGPTTSCTFYGSDVWYKVQIPSSGVVTIRTTAGTMTDAMMAIYSGSCSSLSGIVCEDDNSNGNGSAMPVITVTGTAGAWAYIRIWKWGGGTGTFSICALNYSSVNKSGENDAEILSNSVNSLQIVPNPAQSTTTLSYTLASDSPASVLVYDLQGKLVKTVADSFHKAGKHQQTIDLSDLPMGTYLVRLLTEQGTQTEKLLLTR
ncbi:MAG: peptidoglycan DD-metalloendopeptidase family protein [Chitinophagales bacterium]|nr:peptidoglycan DD-metalloendopeptidase family protein [Chitinophagales bacterium]